MPLPKLTDEQRRMALEKAAEARRLRAELKAKIKAGATTVGDVLRQADANDIIGKMKVSALLESLPNVGKKKAMDAMEELGIATTRRLKGLGERQRAAILERFGR